MRWILPDTVVPAGRTVFTGKAFRSAAVAGNCSPTTGLIFSIRGPERIALTGPNGAGKSTLLRIIDGSLEPDSGTVQRVDGRIASLSQRLDLLAEDRTVAESLAAAAPSLSHTRRMHLLAQFLFRGDRIHLPVAALSGGERLRATLACVLYCRTRAPAAAAGRADEQPRSCQRGPTGVGAQRLPRGVRCGQPRRPVPGCHRHRPVAAAGRRRAERYCRLGLMLCTCVGTRPTPKLVIRCHTG